MDGLDRFLHTFFNAEVAARYWPDIVAGMGVTAGVGILVTLTGLALGLALAILRALQQPWLSLPIIAFVDIMRALPPLVVIIILFFGLQGLGSAWRPHRHVYLQRPPLGRDLSRDGPAERRDRGAGLQHAKPEHPLERTDNIVLRADDKPACDILVLHCENFFRSAVSDQHPSGAQ